MLKNWLQYESQKEETLGLHLVTISGLTGSGFSILSASPWENKYSKYTSSSMLSKLQTEEDGLLLRHPSYVTSASSPDELSRCNVNCSLSKLEHSGRKSSMAANILPHSGSMWCVSLLLSIRPVTKSFDVRTWAKTLSILFFPPSPINAFKFLLLVYVCRL